MKTKAALSTISSFRLYFVQVWSQMKRHFYNWAHRPVYYLGILLIAMPILLGCVSKLSEAVGRKNGVGEDLHPEAKDIKMNRCGYYMKNRTDCVLMVARENDPIIEALINRIIATADEALTTTIMPLHNDSLPTDADIVYVSDDRTVRRLIQAYPERIVLGLSMGDDAKEDPYYTDNSYYYDYYNRNVTSSLSNLKMIVNTAFSEYAFAPLFKAYAELLLSQTSAHHFNPSLPIYDLKWRLRDIPHPQVSAGGGSEHVYQMTLIYLILISTVPFCVLIQLYSDKSNKYRSHLEVMGMRSSAYFLSYVLAYSIFQLVQVHIYYLTCLACGYDVMSRLPYGMWLLFTLISMIYLYAEAIIVVCLIPSVRISSLLVTIGHATGWALSALFDTRSSLLVEAFMQPEWGFLLICQPFVYVVKMWADPIDYILSPKGAVAEKLSMAMLQDYLTYNQRVAGSGGALPERYTALYKMQRWAYNDWRQFFVYTTPATDMVIVLLISLALFVLAFYFDKVLPWHEGHRYSFAYLFSAEYWGCRKIKKYAFKDSISDGSLAQMDPDLLNEKLAVMNATDRDLFCVRDLVKVYRPFGFSESAHNFFSWLFCCRFYNRVKLAVNHFYLMCKPGEVTALLGHNGAGKTTMMNCVTGVYRPDCGDVRFKDLSVVKEHVALNEITGVCPQHDVLFAGMNIINHVALYAGVRGRTWQEIWPIMEERLKRVKLDKVLEKNVAHFSGGMKRRLSFVLSTIGEPDFLMMDEPTTGMDPVNRRNVWNIIEDYKQDHAVLLSTHAMEEADALGDKIAVLRAGQLVGIGNADHLKSRFGSGYRFFVNTVPSQEDNVAALLLSKIPSAFLQLKGYSTVVVVVPDAVVLFRFIRSLPLDQDLAPLISDWGISRTSLIDVFHRLNLDVYHPTPAMSA